MSFDFDKITDRSHTYSEKHTQYKQFKAIPMWVADTEFESPEQIRQKLIERSGHGIFGYTAANDELNLAVQNWLKSQYQWEIEPEWLVWLPGIVPGFNLAVRAFSKRGFVAVQVPNYPPLLAAPEQAGAVKAEISSTLVNGRWALDVSNLEKTLSHPDCHLFLLCNPMNPCGSVLTEEELTNIIEFCETHDVLICSDEIHCDILMDQSVKHLPVGKYQPRSITMMAASKAFNIAGLSCSFAIIPDVSIRRIFQRSRKGIVPEPNLMGYLATQTAFESGKTWLMAMNQYLSANRDYALSRIEKWPGVQVSAPQATFLLWLDFRESRIRDPFHFFLNHGVALSDGKYFGCPGFVRLNYGCQRNMLGAALNKMEQALPR